jgi:cellulose biosynthesis protein BcsQ
MKKDTLSEVYDLTVQKGRVRKSTLFLALAYSFANQGLKLFS